MAKQHYSVFLMQTLAIIIDIAKHPNRAKIEHDKNAVKITYKEKNNTYKITVNDDTITTQTEEIESHECGNFFTWTLYEFKKAKLDSSSRAMYNEIREKINTLI